MRRDVDAPLWHVHARHAGERLHVQVEAHSAAEACQAARQQLPTGAEVVQGRLAHPLRE